LTSKHTNFSFIVTLLHKDVMPVSDSFIIHTVVICYDTVTFFHFESLGLRGYDCKLFKKRIKTDVNKFSFSNYVVDNWNCLSRCCVTSDTINMFKKHVSVELNP